MPFMNRDSTLGHTFRNFDQTIITVKVGKGDHPESFSCHRELLSRCSSYFNRYFQHESTSPYNSKGDNTLELGDAHPDVFDAFMLWLYTGYIPHHLIEGGKEVYAPTHPVDLNKNNGVLPTPPPEEKDDDVDTASWGLGLEKDDTVVEEQPVETPPATDVVAMKVAGEGENEKSLQPAAPTRSTAEKPEIPKETLCPCCSRSYKWRGLEGFLERRFIALYVFAHRYDIPKLRRAVIRAWQTNDEILQSMPDHSNVIAAYHDLPPTSPLCRYFLDMYTVYWNPDNDQDENTIALRSQLPQPFLFELAVVLARGERPKVEKDWCEFHEHENDEERRLCQEDLLKDPVYAKAAKRIKDTKSWKGLVLKKGKR